MSDDRDIALARKIAAQAPLTLQQHPSLLDTLVYAIREGRRGMTWGEFKKLVESTEGVTDDTPVDFIDVGPYDRLDDISVEVEPDGGIAVY